MRKREESGAGIREPCDTEGGETPPRWTSAVGDGGLVVVSDGGVVLSGIW